MTSSRIPRGLHNLLQVTAGVDGWNTRVDSLDLNGVDTRIIKRFRREVQADGDLFQELERVSESFPRRRDIYPADMTAATQQPGCETSRQTFTCLRGCPSARPDHHG